MRMTPSLPTVALAPGPLTLPRARALTDALVCASPPYPALDTAPRLAERLAHLIAGAVAHTGPVSVADQGHRSRDATTCMRIGAYQLLSAGRTSSQHAGPVSGTTRPFRWTARRARRTIGLAGLRMILEKQAGTPAEGVAAVVGRAGGADALGTRRPGSCADWLDSLPPAARVGVRAEATTWATQLWSALEWGRVETAALVGPPDRWWVCGDRLRVALRGRTDVRISSAGGVHLSMLASQPTAESRLALCLSALVELLANGPGEVPARVAGWWPEAGKAWIVPVDDAALCAVATLAGHAAAVRAGGPGLGTSAR